MVDIRIAEWKHLISTGRLKNVLILGTPSIRLLEGLRKTSDKIYIVYFQGTKIGKELKDLQQNDQNIEIVQLQDEAQFPFFRESIAAIITVDGNIVHDDRIDKLLSYSHRILSPGANIMVFTKSGILSSAIAKFFGKGGSADRCIDGVYEGYIYKKMIQHGYKILSVYAFVPSLEEVRWIIPVRPSKLVIKSLAFCKPTLVISKIMKKVAVFLTKFGFTNLWTPFRIIIAQSRCDDFVSKTNLQSLLKRVLCTDDISIALYTGTPGYYQKTTAQLMSTDGKIIAYAKISENSHTGKILENETHVLNLLKSLNLEHGIVPKVIYFSRENGKTICVQSAIRTDSMFNQCMLTNSHVRFLAEIFNKTAKIMKSRESKCIRNLENDIKKLEGRVSVNWIALLKRATYILMRDFGAKEIAFGLSHKDFTPWNSLVSKDKIYVIDWEFAEKESMPFYDILHFEFQKYMVRKNVKASLEGILNDSREFKKLLIDYAFQTNCDTEFLIYYVLFYICDNLVFYLDMTEKYWGQAGIEHSAFSKKRELLYGVLSRIEHHKSPLI